MYLLPCQVYTNLVRKFQKNFILSRTKLMTHCSNYIIIKIVLHDWNWCYCTTMIDSFSIVLHAIMWFQVINNNKWWYNLGWRFMINCKQQLITSLSYYGICLQCNTTYNNSLMKELITVMWFKTLWCNSLFFFL